MIATFTQHAPVATAKMPLRSLHSQQLDVRATLVDWYMATFIPDPARGYALMNPPGNEDKYIRRSTPITRYTLIGSFNGETRRTRPLPVGGGGAI